MHWRPGMHPRNAGREASHVTCVTAPQALTLAERSKGLLSWMSTAATTATAEPFFTALRAWVAGWGERGRGAKGCQVVWGDTAALHSQEYSSCCTGAEFGST